MKTKLMIGAAAVMLVAGGAAIAQEIGRGPMGDMTRADAQARAEQMFDRMDANKDGKIDAADREARMAAMFDRIDTDHNGQLSRAEFTAHHADRGMGEGMRRGGWGGRGHGGGMMGRMADADGNGTVTKAEVVNAAMARFDRADANKDGKITDAERQAMRGQMRERMRGMDHGPGHEGMEPPPGDE